MCYSNVHWVDTKTCIKGVHHNMSCCWKRIIDNIWPNRLGSLYSFKRCIIQSAKSGITWVDISHFFNSSLSRFHAICAEEDVHCRTWSIIYSSRVTCQGQLEWCYHFQIFNIFPTPQQPDNHLAKHFHRDMDNFLPASDDDLQSIMCIVSLL